MEQNDLTSEPGQMGLFGRIVGIFTSPGKTFEAIKEKPNWLSPAIILVLIYLGLALPTQDVILKDSANQTRIQLEKQNVPADQIGPAMERSKTITKIMIFVGPVVGSVVVFLILGAIWLLVSNIILGGNATYSQMLGVTIYKDFIVVLAMLIKLPIILAKQTMDIHFSLATFLPDSEQATFLYKLLSKVELFNIWIIIVLSIGIGVISNAGTKKTWPWVVSIFAIWYLAIAGLGSMFGF